jgi:hypothetical protein
MMTAHPPGAALTYGTMSVKKLPPLAVALSMSPKTAARSKLPKMVGIPLPMSPVAVAGRRSATGHATTSGIADPTDINKSMALTFQDVIKSKYLLTKRPAGRSPRTTTTARALVLTMSRLVSKKLLE